MLQHVAIEIEAERVEACINFYALLGFRRVEPPPSLANRAAWVEREGTQVHLMLTGAPVVPPSGHLAVVAPDYEQTISSLSAAGFKPDPREQHWGSPRAIVRDPAGHRIEVMAFPPPLHSV